MALAKNIIAVGSGKGGVGKSVVCANLAVGMAIAGHDVVLVDADYGASNLHAILGISNPKYGFKDFFTHSETDPGSLLLDTGISDLKFLSGAGDISGSANIGPEHIEKITSFIKNLRADSIFLDLGPGINYNVIDCFNIGSQNVVVTIPEMPSVMNTFTFLKAALFRRFHTALQDKPELHRLFDHSYQPSADDEIHSVEQLKQTLSEIAPENLPTVDAIIASFKPGLVVNRVRRKKDLLLGENLITLTKKYLGVDLQYLGYLVESDRVRDSVEEMIPFLIKNPQSRPSENLQQILGTLTHTDLHLVKKDGMIFVSKQVRLSSSWNS